MKKCCDLPNFYIQDIENHSEIIICLNCKIEHIMGTSQDWFDAFEYDTGTGLKRTFYLFRQYITILPLELQLLIKIS